MHEIFPYGSRSIQKDDTIVPLTLGTLRMVPLRSFASFGALDLLLVMTPGADWAFAIAAGLRRDGVIAAIAGLAAGYLAQAALVAAGLGALLARNADALRIITIAGTAYLLGLGIAVLRHPAPVEAAHQPARSRLRGGLRGAAVSGLNPKGILLVFVVLPQFVVAKAAWPVRVQLAALGVFHAAACAVIYLSVALAAHRLLGSKPSAARIVGRVSGATMIVVALALTLERVA
jgi:threonine/homoserine/homoserine lactone efflux protein